MSVAKTQDHNKDLLLKLGYKQYSNTSVFVKNDEYILSPAVSIGENGYYWFDIREVNLNRINKAKSLLFVRIVPNLFVVEKFNDIQAIFSPLTMENRPHSGNVWSILMDIDDQNNKAKIRKSNVNLTLQVYSLENVLDAYHSKKL